MGPDAKFWCIANCYGEGILDTLNALGYSALPQTWIPNATQWIVERIDVESTLTLIETILKMRTNDV